MNKSPLVNPSYTGKSGIYASVKPRIELNSKIFVDLRNELQIRCVNHGLIFNPEDDLHCTVVLNTAARVPAIDIEKLMIDKGLDRQTEFKALNQGLRVWSSSNKFYIGIVWSSEELANLHYYLSRRLHLVSNFPSYLCHTTIGYVGVNTNNTSDLHLMYKQFVQHFNDTVTNAANNNQTAMFTNLNFQNCKQ